MSRESESLSYFEVLNSEEISEENRKEPKISYAREFLFSLSKLDACKELPNGFDKSILSELDDAYDSTCEHQKLWSSESLAAGRMLGDSTRDSHERCDSSKWNSKDSKSTAKIEEDAEPHKDSRRRYTGQSRLPWQNSESVGIRRSSLQEHSGILGSWSASKQTQGGSEGSDLKSKGTEHSLLTRCNEPYRPPSFYKAMGHPGRQSHDSTSGNAEGASKEKAKEERWRKDSIELARNELSKATEEKQRSPPDDHKENSDPDASGLLECSDVPVISNNRSSPMYPAVSGSLETSCFHEAAENLRKESFSHHSLAEHPQVQQLPSKSQLIRQESKVVHYAEKSKGQILEGGRFAVLTNLKEAENVDPDVIDETNSPARDGQSMTAVNVESDCLKKKELRTHVGSFVKSEETTICDTLLVNGMGKTAINSSPVEVSASQVVVKPSYIASNLPKDSLAVKPKRVNSVGRELHKDSTPFSSCSRQSAITATLNDGSTSEIWQSSSCTERHGAIMEGSDSRKSRSKFVDWFSDRDKASRTTLSWGEKNWNKVEGASLVKENLRDQALSKETMFSARTPRVTEATQTTFPDNHRPCTSVGKSRFPYGLNHDSHHAQEPQLAKITRDQGLSCASGAGFQTTEGSKLNPVCKFHKEADTNIEIHLPDEDSLIMVDDFFIFHQDVPAPSPITSSAVGRSPSFPRSSDLLESQRPHQNLSWQDPWMLQSQMNSGIPFVNSSDSHPQLRVPATIQDPWQYHYTDYNPFVADVVPHPFRQLPMQPQIYEPSIQHFASLRVQPTESFCPHPNNIPSPQPPINHQVSQNPYYQQEPTPLRNLPLNYQRDANSTMAVEKRGVRGDEENKSFFSQLVQMQTRMAQMHLGSVSGAQQMAYGKPINNQFR